MKYLNYFKVSGFLVLFVLTYLVYSPIDKISNNVEVTETQISRARQILQWQLFASIIGLIIYASFIYNDYKSASTNFDFGI